MKKFLAIFLAMALLVSVVPVMADDVQVELYATDLAEQYAKEVGNRWTLPPTTDATRSTWLGWYINSDSEPTQPTNKGSTILKSGNGLILKFPMPVVPEGKLISKYIIQVTADNSYGNTLEALRLPGENLDIKSFRKNSSPYVDIWSDYTKHSAIEIGDDGKKVPIQYENVSNNFYRNFVDITSYVKELYEAGQRDHFYVIFGCAASTRNVMMNISDTTYNPLDMAQTSFYALESEFPLEIVDETIHSGEGAFPSDGAIAWEFTNEVVEASATLNGNDAKVSVDGTRVTFDEALSDCTSYELTITVKDQWEETLSKTYKFSTAFKEGAIGPEIPVLNTYDIVKSIELMGDTYNIMELSFYLLTQFEDYNEALVVRDSEGNDAGVEFVYYDYNYRYDITEPVELAADTVYEFVLKAGVADIHGNALDEDLVMTKFYTGETPYEVGFVGEDALKTEYDYADGKITLNFENGLYANTPVDILVLKDGETHFEKTVISSKMGIIEPVEVSLPMGDYEVLVRPKNASDCYGDSFMFVSDADRIDLWEYVAVDVKGDKDSDEVLTNIINNIVNNWDYIAYSFGFANDYLADVSDMVVFAGKVVEFRGATFANVSKPEVADIADLSDIIDDAAYFTALQLSQSINKVMEYIGISRMEILGLDEDVMKLWEAACASEYRDVTVKAFIDKEMDINNTKELIAEMDSALDVYRTEIIFDKIADPANESEVEQLLAVEKNRVLLGITSFAERYDALESKDVLIEAIAKTEFKDVPEFLTAFEAALKAAEEAGDIPGDDDDGSSTSGSTSSPTSSGGGKKTKGGTTTQIFSSAPVVQEPFNPFVDIDGVEWAKEHIVKLYNTGVINGKSQTSYAPYDNITREEITKLIVSMTNLAADTYSISFADVPSDAWYASYVNAAYVNGVAGGIGSGLFGTGYNATRQDIAVMIVNALKAKGIEITEETANFNDNGAISDYAMEAVAFLNAKGVLSGDANKCFNPGSYATRAEVAVMLSKTNDIFMKEVR